MDLRSENIRDDKGSLQNYHFSEEDDIYIDPNQLSVPYLDGLEKELEDLFKKVSDLSLHSKNLEEKILDNKTRYNLSYLRCNFLIALEALFDKNGTVLEIGSGSGSITRWFAENFSAVDAFEGSLSRAKLTRMRCKDLNNVTVYCGDVTKTRFEKKYSLISLIGVLEYLPLYSNENASPKKTCIEMLSKLSDNLETNGFLVIAIENKFGAKYFSGCKEDHTSKEFDSIIGYPEKSAITFSHNELLSMLSAAGYTNIQFYHAFPDYKYAETIILENCDVPKLYPYNWIRTPFADNWGDRQYLFPEQLFLKEITEAGLLWQFSNSFIIFASKNEGINLKSPWLIKKFHNLENYSETVHHEISLCKSDKGRNENSGYYVFRSPIHRGKEKNTFKDFSVVLEDNTYTPGESLLISVYRALLSQNQITEFVKILSRMECEILKIYGTQLKDSNGFALVSGDAIEYLFSNIIVTPDGKYVLVDKKWRGSNRAIPIDLIIFRNIFHIFYYITPYLKNKNKASFIYSTMQLLFPAYSKERLYAILKEEEAFHNLSLKRKIHLTLKSPVIYSYPEILKLANAGEKGGFERLIKKIQTQEDDIVNLTSLLKESESDRAARLDQVNELTKLLKESESNRAASLVQINELTRILTEIKKRMGMLRNKYLRHDKILVKYYKKLIDNFQR